MSRRSLQRVKVADYFFSFRHIVYPVYQQCFMEEKPHFCAHYSYCSAGSLNTFGFFAFCRVYLRRRSAFGSCSRRFRFYGVCFRVPGISGGKQDPEVPGNYINAGEGLNVLFFCKDGVRQ